MSKTISITQEALNTATDEQVAAIARVARPDSVVEVTVQRAGLGLPEDYLAFNYKYSDGYTIYGGIDPEGRVST